MAAKDVLELTITKVATNAHFFRRETLVFPSARTAFRAFLEALKLKEGEQVLLPAFVGWSPREGSGVLDPVRELGLPMAFYRVTDRLRIDLADLRRHLAGGRVRVLVVIHYFGYVDPQYEAAVALARQHGVVVLEDEAHALYSDLIGGACGRLGDACIYSLHKMLPVNGGGMLVVNPTGVFTAQQVQAPECNVTMPWAYDLLAIARRRVANGRKLTELLGPLAGWVDPLWGAPEAGQVPQTYPVIIQQGSRDKLYHLLNEAGFGGVTLYHTLVPEIPAGAFPDSHALAGRIFNLPVHQDAGEEDLAEMVAVLERLLHLI